MKLPLRITSPLSGESRVADADNKIVAMFYGAAGKKVAEAFVKKFNRTGVFGRQPWTYTRQDWEMDQGWPVEVTVGAKHG